MTYNSELKDGLSVNPDLYVKFGGGDDCKDDSELRALFDQILSFFLKEVSVNKHVSRPFPPKFGDGRATDLFKLFLTVRRVGSYELVSKNRMWGFVAGECGFEFGIVTCLKLIYVKYLKEFDQWLIKGGFKDENVENLEMGVIEKLDLLSHELDKKSLSDGGIVGFKDDKKGKGVGIFELNQNGVGMSLDDGKRSDLSPENVIKKVGFSMIKDDDKRNELSCEDVVKKVGFSTFVDNDNGEFRVDEELRFDSNNDVEKVVGSQKRKRKREEESLVLSEMLDWVTNCARDPHDAAFGTSLRTFKWRSHTSDELWNEALMARRALFAKIIVGSGSQKNPRMHPSMYDDNRVQPQDSVPVQPWRSSSRIKRLQTKPGESSSDRTLNPIEPQEEYNLGPHYQAEVPPWTGVVSESDPKWLGTLICPGPDHHNKEPEKGPIGTGLRTQTSCECLFPGTADCVRFHIAENRLKTKLELGPLFYKWKFNQMGEEVSLSWEPEEEKVFKSLVVRARQELDHSSKSRHQIMNKFWKRASESLLAKTKENLVSYYFNVFVMRRRSYQNRVTPREIDSDDDEKVVGSVGDRFGYEKIHGLPLKCSENLQCTDLES